jgi:hypothetical protein
MNNNKAYILTAAWNDYDQHGEYFIAWFADKPTPSQLSAILCKYEDIREELLGYNLVDYVLNGGGRQETENLWYFLRRVKSGKMLGTQD